MDPHIRLKIDRALERLKRFGSTTGRIDPAVMPQPPSSFDPEEFDVGAFVRDLDEDEPPRPWRRS